MPLIAGGVWTGLEGNYRWSDNYLSFSGNTFSGQAQGETFAAGTLSFGNGVSWADSNPETVELKVESFGDSLDFSQQLFGEIEIFSTPNQDGNGNPLSQVVAADLIYFTEEFKEFGAFRVFEGEVGTVELLYEFNSLHFKGFGEVLTPDTAFLTSSITVLPVPATLWLLWLGLLGMIGMGKKRP